jgi:ribosome assembly protein 1
MQELDMVHALMNEWLPIDRAVLTTII